MFTRMNNLMVNKHLIYCCTCSDCWRQRNYDYILSNKRDRVSLPVASEQGAPTQDGGVGAEAET